MTASGLREIGRRPAGSGDRVPRPDGASRRSAEAARQRKRGESERNTGPQFLLAVRHLRRHRAQIADLHRERSQEGAIEAQFGALQHDRGMLQPGNDAPCRDGRSQATPEMRAAMHGDPVRHQRSRIGGGEFGAGGAHVAQPAETVQRFQPSRICDVDLERRLAACLDQMARKREAAIIDFERDLRIGEPEIRRSDQDALGRAPAIAPAIFRPGAQAAAAPPELCATSVHRRGVLPAASPSILRDVLRSGETLVE